ncbi:lysostaphin resistance A-like protein [Lacisediminihabitans sp. H27-G8]|uniref:CPBP family intramembrane glutamic endopeptidase n=1 Tax=Lacisediminihabitans sp. H27-G8 TaxID=3111909 RepID=UPI0038FD3022
MTEFILYSLPSVIYFLVQGRRRRLGPREAARRLGLTLRSGRSYVWALALLIPLGLLGYAAIALIPTGALSTPGMSVAHVTSDLVAVNVILQTLGEEILFRGLIGGVLLRRLGFGRGNVLQAIIFLAPHLVLLLVNAQLWPIIPVQFITGWVLGWLRYKSGSFLPGTLVHAVANIGSGLIAV